MLTIADTEARVRELFEAFAARDAEAGARVLHPECELFAQPTAELTGRPSSYVGHAGWREYLADVDRVWERFAVDPGDLRVVAGSVIAFGWAEGTPRGGTAGQRVAVIWVIRFTDDLVSWVKVARTAAEADELVR